MQIWKLGCNWGSNAPNFFPLLEELKIVISDQKSTYAKDDLVILAEGHTVKGLAKLKQELAPVTNQPEWKGQFEQYQIPFADDLLYAPVELHVLNIDDRFRYKLQQGIVAVQKEGVRQKALDLWRQYSEHANQKITNNHHSSFPLNQILYGPPGTGKTYHTIDLAAKIIGFDTGNHEANLKAFNARLGKNIAFITFHQSFAYEDFIEGIKPETVDVKDRGKQVTYEVQDGIFKQMAKRAEKAGLNRETQGLHVTFERAFEALRNELVSSETDEVEIPMKRVSYNITDIGPNSISFRKDSGGTGHKLSVDTLRKIYMGTLDYSKEGLGVYFHPLVDYLKEKSETAPQTEEEKTEEPHVLIIDEINRGNVAGVFGELITLIETDKRSGGKHPLKLILPYSKAEFSVPSNLYIIGTMNTADRSVEALDTALRRRFSFTEIGPKPELLKDIQLTLDGSSELRLSDLLTAINDRIEALIDRDHCIGHAYFMGIAEAEAPWTALQEVFHRNILPLLQEYFFGDHGKIGLVLGAGFIKIKSSNARFANFQHDAAQGFTERPIYKLVDISIMDIDDFQSAVISTLTNSNVDFNEQA